MKDKQISGHKPRVISYNLILPLTEEDNVIIKFDSTIQLVFIIVVILLISLAFVVSRRKKKALSERQVDTMLRPFKQSEVRSIIIPDGIGGLLEVERLILMEQGLLIIETYSISGHLFGAERIDQWTQIVEGRSFKFINPLRHIHNSKHALQMLAPKVPIFCRVVFTEESDFPKGKPDEVSTIKTLQQDLQPIKDAPKMSAMSVKAWERILRIARKNGQAISGEVTS